jgi:hypothetical protein
VGTVKRWHARSGDPNIITNTGRYRPGYGGPVHTRVRDCTDGRTVLTLEKGFLGAHKRIVLADGPSLTVRYNGKLRKGMTMDLTDTYGVAVICLAWTEPVRGRTMKLPPAEAIAPVGGASIGDTVLLVALAFGIFRCHFTPRSGG